MDKIIIIPLDVPDNAVAESLVHGTGNEKDRGF